MKVFNRDVSIKRQLDFKVGAAVAAAGAATLNAPNGIVTTEALATAQNATYTLTLKNKFVRITDIVHVTVNNGTNNQGTPCVCTVTPTNGQLVIVISNQAATAVAFNGTLRIGFNVFGDAQ